VTDCEIQLFENLALEHMYPLYGKAIGLARNAADAEDLVQQTYASAYCAFEQFDKNSDFTKWLCEILMRVHINLMSKQSLNVDAITQ